MTPLRWVATLESRAPVADLTDSETFTVGDGAVIRTRHVGPVRIAREIAAEPSFAERTPRRLVWETLRGARFEKDGFDGGQGRGVPARVPPPFDAHVSGGCAHRRK